MHAACTQWYYHNDNYTMSSVVDYLIKNVIIVEQVLLWYYDSVPN